MSHAEGCVNGKHTGIGCQKLSRTFYYNYKEFLSTVLLAICDSNYCFTLFGLGQYGPSDDSGILKNSQMDQMFEDELLQVPTDRKLQKDDFNSYLYFLLGDEIH